MMYSQRQLSQPSLPPYLTGHNKKDKLHNSILNFFKSKQMSFPVHSTGKGFVKSLSDCLLILDGHHATL